MQLCFLCKERFKFPFPEGCCDICKDDSIIFLYNLRTGKIEKPFDARTFYIKGESMQKYLKNEEKFFSYSIGKSIKSWANKLAIKYIKEKTSLKPKVRNPDVIYHVSFPEGIKSFEYGDFYIYGKYKKLKEGISQKRWKKYEKSIEAIIGEKAMSYFEAKQYWLHCSGREDVDVLNFAGRPFVLELKQAKKRYLNLEELEKQINMANEVNVSLYGYVDDRFVEIVSNSHFNKSYIAYLSEELNEDDFEKLNKIKNLVIKQKTPLRVLHRRADKIRKRKIFYIKAAKDQLMIKAEAGTYIKEFISGDKNRTKPSVSSILNKELFCKKLIVNEIDSDFLDFVFNCYQEQNKQK